MNRLSCAAISLLLASSLAFGLPAVALAKAGADEEQEEETSNAKPDADGVEEPVKPTADEEFKAEFDQLAKLDDEWRDYMAQSGSYSARSQDEEFARGIIPMHMIGDNQRQYFGRGLFGGHKDTSLRRASANSSTYRSASVRSSRGGRHAGRLQSRYCRISC